MRSFPATDARIAALASVQHGVVTRSQLRTLGLSNTAISGSARRGRLHGAGSIHVTVPGDSGRRRRRGVRIHRSRSLTPHDTTTHGGIPITNTMVEGVEVDFVWRRQRLIVEVDGYGYHRAPGVFEDDRERDVVLTLAGWTVLRFTWAQVTTRPKWVVGAISKRLECG